MTAFGAGCVQGVVSRPIALMITGTSTGKTYKGGWLSKVFSGKVCSKPPVLCHKVSDIMHDVVETGTSAILYIEAGIVVNAKFTP